MATKYSDRSPRPQGTFTLNGHFPDLIGGRLRGSGAVCTGRSRPGGWPGSWVRHLMPSFMNTLARWYSTVPGLMNIWAAISLFVAPPAASVEDAGLLRDQVQLSSQGYATWLGPSGRIREPSQITEARVNSQLARARRGAGQRPDSRGTYPHSAGRRQCHAARGQKVPDHNGHQGDQSRLAAAGEFIPSG